MALSLVQALVASNPITTILPEPALDCAASEGGNSRLRMRVDDRAQGDSVFAVSATLPSAEVEQRQADGPALLLKPAMPAMRGRRETALVSPAAGTP